jgi:hypothetical protein
MYKYSLDRTSKKFVCPKCNKKKFVRYFDYENNQYLESVYGRCDRESECKFHNAPNKNEIITSPFLIMKKSYSTINSNEISVSGRNFKNNNFIQYLKEIFSEHEIKNAILKYCIGTSNYWNGATIFWQINNFEKVNTGKVMLFDIENGKRVKKPYSHINWMHKILKLQNFELQQCLFGLHLINEQKTKIIGLVESEKTAVIMSIFVPDFIWLATGSKANLKYQLLKPIKEYQVLAFPDKSEYEDWNKRTIELNQLGFKIKCSKIIEKLNVENGYDLADYYIDNNKASDDKITTLTKYEKIISRIAQTNPQILNLVKTFDLVDESHNNISLSKINIDVL